MKTLYLFDKPKHLAKDMQAEISEEAMDLLKADYFRPEMPPFEACYRRVQTIAKMNGWALPSFKVAKAMIKAEVPEAVWERKMYRAHLHRQVKQARKAVQFEQAALDDLCNQEVKPNKTTPSSSFHEFVLNLHQSILSLGDSVLSVSLSVDKEILNVHYQIQTAKHQKDEVMK